MAAEPSPRTAVVVARDEETRILLRGLLRLRHFRIVGEAEGSTEAAELVRLHQPKVLVVDASLAEGSAGSLIRTARQIAASTRIVLVGPPGPNSSTPAISPAPDATLPRPFRIHDFERAVAVAEPAARTPPG